MTKTTTRPRAHQFTVTSLFRSEAPEPRDCDGQDERPRRLRGTMTKSELQRLFARELGYSRV